MGLQKDRPAGRLIDAARFHPDEAVFDEIEKPDPVFRAIFVQARQDRGWAERLAVDRDRVALFKRDLDEFRRVGRILDRDDALGDVIGRLDRRIFQNPALGRGMQQVRIDGKGRLAPLVLGDRDLVLFGEFQKLGAARQVPFPPWRDDPDRGIKRIGRKLEPHLIVALAGRAMGHGIGAMLMGDIDEVLGNQRPRDRGAKKVQPLIDRVGAEHREDEIAHEFLAYVDDMDVLFLDPQHQRLGPRGFQFFTLAEIGGEGDDLAAVFGLKPFQDDRGVETAGIGQHDFLGRGHGDSFAKSVPQALSED